MTRKKAQEQPTKPPPLIEPWRRRAPMKEDIRDLWVSDVLTGDFIPYRGVNLRGPLGEFNPLGRLCELYRLETAKGDWQPSTEKPYLGVWISGRDPNRVYENRNHTASPVTYFVPSSRPREKTRSILPYPVMLWAGLPTQNPLVPAPQALIEVLKLKAMDLSALFERPDITREKLAEGIRKFL